MARNDDKRFGGSQIPNLPESAGNIHAENSRRKGRRGDPLFRAGMRLMQSLKILPKISDTEREALEAGDVWIDGELFGGNPHFKHMLSEPYGQLTAEEQAFVDGPVKQLCRMYDPYQVQMTHRIPDDVAEFIKSNGFMGLFIPKEYGGKGFSRLAVSTIMHTLTPHSFTVGTLVMIPNSLGAAELILAYGTDEQKQTYLPKLANGEYVPCFGLTEATAGSDAASIKAHGEVFRDADGQIKLKLNFRKRYITLAPIANLVTIACRLVDPENLLGKTPGEDKDLGITCVLLHKGTPGFTNGDHHRPIGETFDNGPLIGKDVVVPVENIIGGADGAGMGWKMLMEQLAGGRSISLPAGAIGNMKMAMAATGAYSMVRQQFNRQIGVMEGVEQKIAFIAAMTYMCEAARIYACSAIDSGIEPPVTSAVLKAYTTDLARQSVTAGMDVFAGAAVMQGPRNILGKLYSSAPVGITVEGANILTRTLMIFGQGSTRCHPYAQNVVNAVENEDVPAFRKNLLGWIGHFVLGCMRTFVRSTTRGLTVSVPDVAPGTRSYYRRLGWAAAHFGTLTDLAMFAIGGELKARGGLTGRYADAVAYMLLGFSALRRFEAEGRRQEDRPLVEYALEYSLHQVQVAFEGIYDDFEAPFIGSLMRTFGALWVRMNRLAHPPTSRASHRAAATVQSYGEQFQRLTSGLFIPDESLPGLGRLLKAFRLSTETEPLSKRIIKAQKSRELPRGYQPAEIADQAVTAGLITSQEAARLQEAHEARLHAVEVDVFTAEQYYRSSDVVVP
jgi:acyl-CoA dehydrogenase